MPPPPIQVGMCFIPPAKNSNCAIDQYASKSYVLLGSGQLPKSVVSAGGLSSLNSVPLIVTSIQSNSAADQSASKFKSQPLSVAIPAYSSSSKPSTFDVSNTTVLWDSGAASQSSVPAAVYNAALQYYNNALPNVGNWW